MPDTKNIPIRWGKYINHDMEEEKVMFIGAEKAIYGSDGRRLDEKLVDMEGSLSDAFSETKDYAVGEYCVYTNRVFKFTKAKTAGEWDGTAVIPVSLAQEISEVSRGIAALNSHFALEGSAEKFVAGHGNTIPLYIKTMHSGDSFSQLTLNSRGADLGTNIGGTWTTLWEVATKSDLGNQGSFKIVETEVNDLNHPPNAFILFTNPGDKIPGYPASISGNRVLVLQCYPADTMYTAQLAFGFGADRIGIRRRRGSSTWTEWKYFTAS